MDCCLWFNRCRISDAAEIAENFDIAALRGYFLGGRLADWLREHGGEAFADKIANIAPDSPDLDVQLARVFGKSEPERRVVFGGIPAEHSVPNAGSFAGSGVMGSSFAAGSGFFGGFGAGSGSAGGYLSGSGYYGSFLSGSYSGGSYGSFRKFRLWEWEWEWRFGGSFRGSFRGGSFAFGSYMFGSGAYLLGSFNRGSFSGSFPVFGSFGGAYGSFFGWNGMTAEEYDRIMYECLRKCPLDCFGYGIHII